VKFGTVPYKKFCLPGASSRNIGSETDVLPYGVLECLPAISAYLDRFGAKFGADNVYRMCMAQDLRVPGKAMKGLRNYCRN
jgi:hypothetical protein